MWSRSLRSVSLGVLCLAALIVLAPMPADACTSLCQLCWDDNCRTCTISGNTVTCTDCGPRDNLLFPAFPATTVDLLPNHQARITINGYVTTAMQSQLTECIVGFSPVEGIQGIEEVRLVATDTGEILTALEFLPSLDAGSEFAALADEYSLPGTDPADWLGFASTVIEDVPEGLRSHFELIVNLEDGVRPRQLLEQLHQVYFGSGGYTLGEEDHHHNFLRPLADGGLALQGRSIDAGPVHARP